MARAKGKPYSRSANVKKVFKGAMARTGIDTQRELADLVGVSPTWISDRFAGKKDFSLPMLWIFDKIFVFTDEEWLKLRDCARK